MSRQTLQQRQVSCPTVIYPDLSHHPDITVCRSRSKNNPQHVNVRRRVSAPASPFRNSSNPNDLVRPIPQGPKRRKVTYDATSEPPMFIPCGEGNDQMKTFEYILSCMEQPLDKGCVGARADHTDTEDDTSDKEFMKRYGGLVYILSVQDPSATLSPILKIGRTARPLQQRKRELERCLKRPVKIIHESIYRQTRHFERLEKLVHISASPQRCRFACQACQRSHSEYFRVSHETALRTLDRWRKWLDEAEPYRASGSLSKMWTARLCETRAALPRRPAQGYIDKNSDFNLDEVLDFMTQPFTYPEWLAQYLRLWCFTPSPNANQKRLRFTNFQKCKNFIASRSFFQLLSVVFLIVSFRYFQPFYTKCSLFAVSLLGILLWWARIEYEIRLKRVLCRTVDGKAGGKDPMFVRRRPLESEQIEVIPQATIPGSWVDIDPSTPEWFEANLL